MTEQQRTTSLHELTGAYALDALDDLERAAVERHLRDCPECAVEVAGFREVAARLADRVAEPVPSMLRDRVMAQVSITRQVPAAGPRRRLSVPRSLTGAAAAVLLVAGGLGGVAWQSHEQAERAQVAAAQSL